jgi:AraC-like DNA-binding protein
LFDDVNIGFDNYSDSVRAVDVTFILSGPNVLSWSVAQYPLNEIVLQFGNAGGATIALGVTRPDITLVVLQRPQFEETSIFNGQSSGPYDIAILPPASTYTFVSQGPSRWLSIVIPQQLQNKPLPGLEDLFRAETMNVSPLPDNTRALTALALQLVAEFTERTVHSGHADDRMLQAIVNAVQGTSPREPRARLVRMEKTIVKALDFIRSDVDGVIRLTDICDFVDVKERTFRRLFHDYFGMSPNHYLKLRQLNLVRRAIRFAEAGIGVTSILSAHGVTEFGRFAGEYKSLFGESPSETARTHLTA